MARPLPAYVPSTSLEPDIASVSNGPDVATDPALPPPGNSFHQAMNQALGVGLAN
jgi:putative aldouronate transport system substrate-binding protein